MATRSISARSARKFIVGFASCAFLLLLFYWIYNKFVVSYSFQIRNEWTRFDIVGREQKDPELVKYLRQKVVISPNNLPYVLRDPFVSDPTSVELAQLADNIFKGKKRGVFFEAGAYHPESHSMTIHLERFYGWSGLLVEPNPALFETLKDANRKAFMARACLSPQKSPIKLNLTSQGMQSKLIDKESENKNDMTVYQVDCFPVFSLLLAANLTSIDYFVLDVEGFEMSVLRTIPFHLVDVAVFVIEHYNNPKPEELQRFMEEKDYVTVNKTIYDFIFVKK